MEGEIPRCDIMILWDETSRVCVCVFGRGRETEGVKESERMVMYVCVCDLRKEGKKMDRWSC